ncbi:MAG: hypothetical protein KatS3mg053_1172 [Candidatus Roseilinea sp.]|nr:MAG: hypothetical protein KatS3mg053_1172 [Candidatus Roseilinea sp.]
MLLSFYFKMSCRDFEALLLISKTLRDVLELMRIPDDSARSRMAPRFQAGYQDKMSELLLSSLNDGGLIQEDAITLDSTSFRPTLPVSAFRPVTAGRSDAG